MRSCIYISIIILQWLVPSTSVAEGMELSGLVGVVATQDPSFARGSSEDVAINANSGNSGLIIFNILQNYNFSGGANFYEFIVGSTTHDLKITSGDVSEDVEIDAFHYHIGGTYGFEPGNRMRPYFGMTIGLSEYESSNGYEDSFLSGTLAAGLKFDVSDHIALRVDARMLATLVEENTSIFCTNTSCEFLIEGDTWWQYQMNAGVVYKF